ncbi:probable 2' cyclic ADP-D-ribose synthase BdTIR [Cryptomeria japonica]|uniref:probable 2' cyclic ADP-D-ribose synthase BdTIR n=1 Tax=Cryptomeria japonica TaxID=3369 RepID=UPI0027DA6191|nr:probable 2' cyclic ADP-D-ribose synthase BdTIR [Cryptomeria japonica]
MASSSSRQNNVRDGAFSQTSPESRRVESSTSPRLFDVFINHHGPDVKATLALHLYNSLQSEGFRAFLDCKEIELGELFPSTIESAISSSLVHIAIFSKGYVQSDWCLDELTLVSKSNAEIIPVFYDVIPSDLRCIGKTKGVYADVFAEYEHSGKHIRTLEKWKESLLFHSLVI